MSYARTCTLCLLTIVGCTTLPPLRNHLVMLDRRGEAVQLVGSSLQPLARQVMTRPVQPAEGAYAFQGIVEAIRESGRRKVLLFVHGGLNSPEATIRRSQLAREIMADPDGFYPVFIGWDASLLSSYLLEHLVLYRQGQEVPWAYGLLWSPVVLAGDLIRGVVRAPYVWLLEISALADALGDLPGLDWIEKLLRSRVPLLESPADRSAHATADVLLCRFNGCACEVHASPTSTSAIARGLHGSPLSERLALLRGVLWLPLRVALSPIIEGAGSGAWAAMKRRIELVFEPEIAFEEPHRGPSPLLQFLNGLHGLQAERGLEVTLVAHSMGAILANEMLRLDVRYGGAGRRSRTALPQLSNLVYMASAASTRGYLDSAIPYLRKHAATRIFHLTLHPRAESGERHPKIQSFAWQPFDWLPPGSLLVWLDSFLEEPVHQLDRRAGRYLNLMHSVARTPEDLADRIHLKIFPHDAGPSSPQRHSDFSRLPFWDTAFWTPDPVAGAGGPWERCPPFEPLGD